MDGETLAEQLDAAFDAPLAERRVVVRQAVDLADAGRWADTHDGERLTAEQIVRVLGSAPSGDGLADRWNWWMGSLEVAYGEFERFSVRGWPAD